MLIYEVNFIVEGDAAPRFSPWLREHVRETLTLDGFEAAVWYTRYDDADTIPGEDETTEPREWTVHYQVRDREVYEAYLENHADDLRRDGTEKFGDHIEITRSLFEQQRLFQGG